MPNSLSTSAAPVTGSPGTTLAVTVACGDGEADWPYRKRLMDDTSMRLRHVRQPYEDLASAACHVVLLHCREVARGLPPLLKAMADRPRPLLLICSAADTGRIATALRLGATGCLVEGDYQGWTLRNALWSTAAGHTYLSPTAAAALTDVSPYAAHPQPGGGSAKLRRMLSSRERQIMDLLAHGLRPVEIGQQLCITAKTVRNNLSSIYAKLGVTGRTEAVVRWLDASPHAGPQRRSRQFHGVV